MKRAIAIVSNSKYLKLNFFVNFIKSIIMYYNLGDIKKNINASVILAVSL